MHQIVIQNAAYQIQRIFVGSKPVTDLIQQRVCSAAQNFPLTNAALTPYNEDQRTVVRRYNG